MLKKLFRLFKFVLFHPLNRNNRLAAIWRVISFQIASRITNNSILLPYVNNTYLITKHGMTGATGNWYFGLSEFEDMGFLLHTLKPGDLFVDIGANIGSYSILAASCKDVKVEAFEPIPSTFFWLQKNIQVNSLNQVNAMNIGLADKKNTVYFSSNLDTVNHVLSDNEKNYSSIQVDVFPLDEVLKEKCPTIIKIDVEGYESQVLDGAKNIINNPSLIVIIIELNGSGRKYGKKDSDIHKLLTSKGFESFKYDPLKYKLKHLNNEFNSTSNTLYIRKLDEVQQRISRKTTFMLGSGKQI